MKAKSRKIKIDHKPVTQKTPWIIKKPPRRPIRLTTEVRRFRPTRVPLYSKSSIGLMCLRELCRPPRGRPLDSEIVTTSQIPWDM